MVKSCNKLAINGGTPIFGKELAPYKSILRPEKEALKRVAESGSLSGFYGNWGSEFLGGPEVKKFEAEWAKKFDVPFAVSVNSATSGLYAALAAIEVSPGDEIIVPPTTMSATVMGPLIYGAIPVFCDIEPETFCLDVNKIYENLTSKTKAIVVVNLFGHPAKLDELSQLCKREGIFLIEDNSQSPLAKEGTSLCGTVGDIGVFSLNYHKHLHSGEGGVCVTKDPNLAIRLQAVRNHAENVIDEGNLSPVNMVGFNYRMTEMSAAVASAQLSRVEELVEQRKNLAEALSKGVEKLSGLKAPVVREKCNHVYYIWALKYDKKKVGVSRERFSAALLAEGFKNFTGYVKPLYLLPTFQKRIAIGNSGWPFNLSARVYEKGLCPVAETLYEEELICFEPCAYEITEENTDKLIMALQKVYHGRESL